MVSGGMGMSWLFGALLLVGLILLAVVLAKSVRGTSMKADGPGVAADRGAGRGREILDERYARGELSAQEYRKMRDTLEDGDR